MELTNFCDSLVITLLMENTVGTFSSTEKMSNKILISKPHLVIFHHKGTIILFLDLQQASH